MISPIVLLVLDGWGIGAKSKTNAIYLANTPNMDGFAKKFPYTQIKASGEAVGLPKGEDGNTETGHINIGAGRVVYQDLPRINMAIADGSFFQNETLKKAVLHVKNNNSALHLMGLVGMGGVHSYLEHIWALVTALSEMHFDHPLFLHLFTDGRDSPPTSGVVTLSEIESRLKLMKMGQIVTISGRYYAMDRDNRYERTLLAYNGLLGEEYVASNNLVTSLKEQYKSKQPSDEFVKPIALVDEKQKPIGRIGNGDAVIFFNFRIDRPRQLTKAFLLSDAELNKQMSESKAQRVKKLSNLFFATMTEYEKGLPVEILYPPEQVEMPLSRVLSEKGIKQLKIAETEKERFVTYYFNGLWEKPLSGEDWVTIPSKKVPTYDQTPEMSTLDIAERIVKELKAGKYQVIICNIAAPDMVAHTGVLKAAIKACEITDQAVGMVADAVNEAGGALLITADHGNAEELVDETTGEVDTKHSTSVVPFMAVGENVKDRKISKKDGKLADIAPTILNLLDILKPTQMDGESLLT